MWGVRYHVTLTPASPGTTPSTRLSSAALGLWATHTPRWNWWPRGDRPHWTVAIMLEAASTATAVGSRIRWRRWAASQPRASTGATKMATTWREAYWLLILAPSR